MKNKLKYFLSAPGFTMPEVMMSLGIISIILGLSFFIFHQSAGSFQEIDLTSHLTERLQNGLNILRKDLRETDIGTISYLDYPLSDFPDSHAWTMATARNSAGVFQRDAGNNYEADWQGVIVYCLYKEGTDKPRELRRYISYGTYTFPILFNDITSDQIRLEQDITIDRSKGIISNNPAYRVSANMIARATIAQLGAADIYYRITLKAEGRGRKENRLSKELSAYVHPRN